MIMNINICGEIVALSVHNHASPPGSHKKDDCVTASFAKDTTGQRTSKFEKSVAREQNIQPDVHKIGEKRDDGSGRANGSSWASGVT